uniref:Uncharacterized protein n=1 Tax=Fagus sylvatica TaxID=28930 RepID=A0A2N9GWN9_FAGSY
MGDFLGLFSLVSSSSSLSSSLATAGAAADRFSVTEFAVDRWTTRRGPLGGVEDQLSSTFSGLWLMLRWIIFFWIFTMSDAPRAPRQGRRENDTLKPFSLSFSKYFRTPSCGRLKFDNQVGWAFLSSLDFGLGGWLLGHFSSCPVYRGSLMLLGFGPLVDHWGVGFASETQSPIPLMAHTSSSPPKAPVAPSMMIDSNSYQLHSGDNPGILLVTQPLSDNYQTWSRSMLMALTAKNKAGFIDGCINSPDLSSPLDQILLVDPLPSINKVFSLVTQEERQRDLIPSSVVQSIESAVAFAATNSRFNSGTRNYGKKERHMCSHCGIPGHTVDKCYKLHGYPPSYRSKNKAMANQVMFAPIATDMTNEASTSSPQVATVISSTSNLSGVTDHMIHSITLFTTISSVLHTNVELPNGEFALVTHIGTVKLSNSLTLTNVLCVPSFSFNLIPDLVRWRTIGMGEEKGGLYFLQGQTPSSATSQGPSSLKSVSVSVSVSSANKTVTNRSSNQDMWHYWLGHPSYSNFHFL